MIYSTPYRKDSGIEITKEEPYLTKMGKRYREHKTRNKVRNGYYLQTIAEWDSIHHKFINQKRIIHQKY